MPVVSHEVHALFAEPYFRASIAGSITPDQIAFIQSLKMVQNMENLMSENLYIFEEPELKSVKDAVQEVLDIYARDVLCIPQQLYVTQSWSLISTPNVGMHRHSHSNSFVRLALLLRPAHSALDHGVHPAYQLSADRTAPRSRQAQHLQFADQPAHPRQNDVFYFPRA